MKAKVVFRDLKFIRPGKTSRGVLFTKPSWFIVLQQNDRYGVGECSIIPGLSPEYDPDQPQSFIRLVNELIAKINAKDLINNTLFQHLSPSLEFGLETALVDLENKETGILFPSGFTSGKSGIPINGLIWMGDEDEMVQQIKTKTDQGFRCLKLKVGALDIETELDVLAKIRKKFDPASLELRIDANGAFHPDSALKKLSRFAKYKIHSVEQPIKPGLWKEMYDVCRKSDIPVALDEELIGIVDLNKKEEMLRYVMPSYIILKPSLLGGFGKSMEWIKIAEKSDIRWWVTSALESNVGLSAISQWAYTLESTMVQGLGTGQVFSNNIHSPLQLRGPELFYDPEQEWDWSELFSFE